MLEPATGVGRRYHHLVLKVGEPAPSFAELSTSGDIVSLAGLRGRSVVLYFFRKAFTPNCTVETRGFRDNYAELRAHRVEVIGISSDSYETQCRFASAHDVSFPMIPDTDKQLCMKYGVLFPLLPIIRRVTYVLDERHIIAAVFHHEFQANRHLDDVLRFVRKRPSSAPPEASA